LIVGLPESPVSNVVLENVNIQAQTGFIIGNAKGIEFKNSKVEVKSGEAFQIHNAEVTGVPK